jgi:hypothetical protein
MNDDRADLQRDRTPTGDLDAAVPGTPVTPLRSLHNFRIAEGDPDVRGWNVLGADGRKIGEVDELLVDTQGLRVRYLDVTLDLESIQERGDETSEPSETLDAGAAPALAPGIPPYGSPLSATSAMGGLAPLITETVVRTTLSDEENRLTAEHHHGPGTRHVLIPIGNARLDPEHDRILVMGLSAASAAGLPEYNGQDLDREYETTLLRQFDRTYSPAPERDFYAHDLYDESRFYGPRRQRAGSGQPAASPSRTAGLEPGGATRGSEDRIDRGITGELDRAVDAPDHNVTEDSDAALPGRGRS